MRGRLVLAAIFSCVCQVPLLDKFERIQGQITGTNPPPPPPGVWRY